jgi:hypothetical protein
LTETYIPNAYHEISAEMHGFVRVAPQAVKHVHFALCRCGWKVRSKGSLGIVAWAAREQARHVRRHGISG